MLRIKQRIKRELAQYTRDLYKYGLSVAKDGGDLSIRDPETNLIYICPKPSEKLQISNWGVIKTRDIVVINIEGNVVEKTDIEPTIEYPMHTKIYNARSQVNAIVHSHAVWSTSFAVARKEIPVQMIEFNYIQGPVKCAKFAVAGTDELAEYILEAMGESCKAALLADHGAVAVGKDIAQAFNVAKHLEKAAQVAIFSEIIKGR